jgi:glycosyltransferase involved in cell wall biosynthesis
MVNHKDVLILMACYNGEKYLEQQLESLAQQTHKNWRLIASDDGSTDSTIQILKKYQQFWGTKKLEIRQRSKADFVQNFLSMACDPKVHADYYAFCDQDDVWLPEKLAVAVQCLAENEKSSIPQLYCGRTAYVRDDLKPYLYSPHFIFPKSFRNALVQCVAGGNTMVFNQTTKNMLEDIGSVPTPSHDWWLYQIVTGAGGYVYYESKPYILYRQHPNSLVGSNSSNWSKFQRMLRVFGGKFVFYSDRNIECLELGRSFLNQNNTEILDLFKIMRGANLKDRFRLMEVCGLYRQTWRGTLCLIFSAVIKKI